MSAINRNRSLLSLRRLAGLGITLLCALGTAGVRAADVPATPAADQFVSIARPPQPEAAYALQISTSEATLWIRSRRPAGATSGAAVFLLARCNATDLKQTLASAASATDGWDYAQAKLPVKDGKLDELRLSFLLEWAGPVNGQPLRRERYLSAATAAVFRDAGDDPATWNALDIEGYRQTLADRGRMIQLQMTQPFAGKLSVVIEDAQGKRIRNLAGGVAQPAGALSLPWDGTDDSGNLVPPGAYRWRAAHHPGITPEYLGCYNNGGEKSLDAFGTNHGTFTSACADQERVYIAAPITEGGWAMIALDDAGNWLKGFPEIHGTGYDAVGCASDGTYFYAVHEGPAPGQEQPRSSKDKTRRVEQMYDFNLTRYTIATGAPVSFKGGKNFVWFEHPYKRDRQTSAGLRGVALVDGKLFVSSAHQQEVLVVDPATAKIERTLPLPQAGPLATDGKVLFAASGETVVAFDPQTGATKPLLSGLRVNGLSYDAQSGVLYVSDLATQTVKSYRDGKLVREYGEPGGAYVGKYRPERLVNPSGIVTRAGKLWITEGGRHNPKRISMWSVAEAKVLREKFGNAPYGGSGASFDPANPLRYVGMGCEWEIDLAAGTEKCRSVFFGPDGKTATPVAAAAQAAENAEPVRDPAAGHLGGYYRFAMRYRYHRESGRTFLIGAGMIDIVSELRADGSLRDLAGFSSVELFRYGCNWQPPRAFEDDLAAHLTANPPEKGNKAELQVRYMGVLWTDRNGNGRCDRGEFQFTLPGMGVGKSSWGNLAQGLDLTVPLLEETKNNKRNGFAILHPGAFDANGAPQYPALADAIKQASWIAEIPAGLGRFAGVRAEAVVDRAGNLILNSQPNMVSLDPTGQERWFYPNQWVGVHGSHNAPLPAVGVMQGNLFFLGTAPLDEKNDVFILNGNHGRYFILTSDGFYLDEMFRDVRLGGARDANWVGGEPFGGYFGRLDNGEYRLITGSNGYRVYRIGGLDKVRRSAGELTVTPEQAQAAAREQAKRAVAAAADTQRLATAKECAKVPNIDGNDPEWNPAARIKWGGGENWRPTAQAAIGYDKQNLYLFFYIVDDSPWVNNGKDWQALFKTGDSVNLELSTDRAADQARNKPAPGDLRVLIAPFDGKNIAVLYKHRLAAGADKSKQATFTSPWRSEVVDEVRELSSARIAVQRKGSEAYAVEVALPLAELGLNAQTLKGQTLKADLGFILGDSAGTINLRRSYWSNQATGLVNDVPGEIMLTPNLWGNVEFK